MSEKIVKIVNNTTYVFMDGQWFNEKSNVELDPHDPDYRVAWDIKPI